MPEAPFCLGFRRVVIIQVPSSARMIKVVCGNTQTTFFFVFMRFSLHSLCLNRLVTMFIDYAELMAEDEVLMSMKDWLDETDIFLKNNRREVLSGKGTISHDIAVKKASEIYEEFRKKQDMEYISEFDREMQKYYTGNNEP